MQNDSLVLRFCRTASLLAVLAVTGTCVAQQTVEVSALRLDGVSVNQLDGVLIKVGKDSTAKSQLLKVGDPILEQTELTVPARSRIVLVSRHGNSMTLSAGARFRVGKVTDRGEDHSAEAGEVSFSVRKALDFYQVGYRKFLATVKGTQYQIRVDEGRDIEFTVTEGSVEVERTGKVLITEGTKQRDVDGVRQAEEIKAGQSRKYSLSVSGYLRQFMTLSEAEAYYREALNAAKESGDHKSLTRAKLNLGVILLTFSRPREARVLFEEILIAIREKPGADPVAQLATIHMLIGATYAGDSEFSRAKAEYKTALEIKRANSGGTDDGLVAGILNQAAMASVETSDFDAALTQLDEAERILAAEADKGGAELRHAISNNIGLIYLNRSEFSKALAQFEKTLSLIEDAGGGEKLPVRYPIVLNLGNSALSAGQYRKAIQYYEQSLSIARQLYGDKDQEDIATALNNLGTAHDALSEYSTAADYYAQALAMLRRLYGERDHRATAQAMNGLGLSFLRLSKLDKAVETLEPAIAMSKRVFDGKDQKDLATLQTNLGFAYAALGNYAKAVVALEEADSMLERLMRGAPDSTRIRVLANLATAYGNLGKTEKGIAFGERAVAMSKAIYGDQDNPAVAEALAALGSCQLQAGDPVRARASLLPATQMQSRIFEGKDNMSQVQSLALLASAEMLLGSAQAAIEPLEKAVAIARRLLGKNDSYLLAIILGKLGTAYSTTGESRRAMEALDASLAMQRRILGNRENDQIFGGLVQLASACQSAGETDRTLEVAREAIAMAKRLYPKEDHHQLIFAYVLLASAAAEAGELKESLAAAQFGMALANRLSANPLQLGLANIGLGLASLSAAKFREAISAFNTARRLFRTAFGSDRNEMGVRAMIVLGASYDDSDEFAESTQLFDRASSIATEVYGEKDHPLKVALGMMRIPQSLRLGQLAFAEKQLGTYRAMEARLIGSAPHPHWVQIELADGILKLHRRDYPAAEAQVEAARRIATQLSGTAKTKSLSSVFDVQGGLQARQGKYVDAVHSLEQHVAERRAFYKEVSHPSMAQALANLAVARAATGDVAEADKLIAETNAILKQVFPKGGHSSNAAVLKAEGEILKWQKRFDEALSKLDESLGIRQKIFGNQPSPELRDLLTSLAECSAGAGKMAKAMEYRERVSAIESAWLANK